MGLLISYILFGADNYNEHLTISSSFGTNWLFSFAIEVIPSYPIYSSLKLPIQEKKKMKTDCS